MFCDAPTCKAIQPVDGKECNYFNLFGIDENFKVDERKLEFEFKNLQKQLHPDKHGMKCLQERQASQQASSVVNQAYQVTNYVTVSC
jgi:molecular chaperone HscB